MGQCTSEYPRPKGIIPKDVVDPQSMLWKKKWKQAIPKVSILSIETIEEIWKSLQLLNVIPLRWNEELS